MARDLETYRRFVATIFWEDSGLASLSDPEFADIIAQAERDADPDNPEFGIWVR